MRQDIGPLDDLVESIRKYGQLVPAVVDDQDELIDGFRRFNALQKAGVTTILAVRKEEVNELLFREIELETNLQRKDLSWPERVRSISEIDKLRRIANPSWTQGQTAAVAGVHRERVSEALQLSKMMDLFPELAQASSLRAAKSRAEHLAKTVLRAEAVSLRPEDFSTIEQNILLGDSVELIRQVPDAFCKAIITDPPFGIGFDDRISSVANQQAAYSDTSAQYQRILSMASDFYRILEDDGWMIYFFGMSWYPQCVDAFESVGFKVDPVPIVWDRSAGFTHTNRPDLYFAKGYDVALHCIKGNPQMIQRGKSNVLSIPPVKTSDRELVAERPIELYEELIRRLTIPGELVADFFVGSGSCPAAAAKLGRRYFGCELDPARRLAAIHKIKANTPSGKLRPSDASGD